MAEVSQGTKGARRCTNPECEYGTAGDSTLIAATPKAGWTEYLENRL